MKTKFKMGFLSILLMTSTLFVSCENESDKNTNDSRLAEMQLLEDYSNYTLSNIVWSKQQGYEIASFSAVTKSAAQNMKAWYKVGSDNAKLQMESKDLGITIPDVIKTAFDATIYSNTTLWTIEEVEFEQDFIGNSVMSTYDVELVSVTDPNIEAELIFDAESGELLFSKEEADNDTESDNFVVNAELKAAVTAIYPTATIIGAEIDDTVIEVDAIVEIDGVKTEIEMIFSLSYEYIGEETEATYTYATMPAEFVTISNWFKAQSTYPEPAGTDIVEIASEKMKDITLYEVEVEYMNKNVQYEAEFILDSEYVITISDIEIDE